MIRIAYAETRQLNNPFASSSSLDGLLFEILNVVLIIAIPIIMFFLIYAGFTFVTARGNPEQVKQAWRSLLYGLIGAVIILGGYAIFAIIESVVNEFD